MAKPNWKKDAGIGLVTTTTIFMSVLIWAALKDPSFVVKEWRIFGPFVILPILVGLALYALSKRSN